MRIEDEIQQKDYKDDHRRLVVNLLFTNNWLNQQFIPFFKKLGLTLQQYTCNGTAAQRWKRQR